MSKTRSIKLNVKALRAFRKRVAANRRHEPAALEPPKLDIAHLDRHARVKQERQRLGVVAVRLKHEMTFRADVKCNEANPRILFLVEVRHRGNGSLREKGEHITIHFAGGKKLYLSIKRLARCVYVIAVIIGLD